jgi:hypothetical protein
LARTAVSAKLLLASSTVISTAGTAVTGRQEGGLGGNLVCDTRSHALSELVEEVWLMPET